MKWIFEFVKWNISHQLIYIVTIPTSVRILTLPNICMSWAPDKAFEHIVIQDNEVLFYS